MPRLLIFNLPREANRATVQALVEDWHRSSHSDPGALQATIALHGIPGAEREQFAVVYLPGNRSLARQLAAHLNGSRHVGPMLSPRPLWSWLPVMAWA